MISTLGRVKSLKKGKGARAVDGILKNHIDQFGYCLVNLTKSRTEQKLHRVHRLVGQAFIPNPDNKPEIDHIDRNTQNNCVSNLRWATRSEQCLNTSKQDTEYNNIGFRVRISRKDLGFRFDKTFLTLKEAITARDKILADFNLSQSDNEK